MRKKILIGILSLLLFLTMSQTVLAVSWLPLVPCGVSNDNPDTPQDETQPCNQCDLFRLLKNIIDFVLMGLMPPAAAILFVWGGFLILMGGANPGLISQGKTIFWNTAIGVAIISASWLMTNTVIRSIAADNIAPEWWKFECRVGTAVSPTPTPTVSVTPTPTGSVTPTPTRTPTPTPSVTPTPTRTPTPTPSVTPTPTALVCGQPWETNLCQARSMTCTASACSQYVTAINQYAGGVASANLLKAVMIKESACNISADSGHAYGLMQLVPSTANIYRSRCNVTENVTATWLKTPANATASICIASEFIRALSSTSCGSTTRNLAAGYNGGSGACANSVSCAGTEKSCDGLAIKKWECLYDNPQHNACNTGYYETRDYATKVLYCYNNPGF